MRSEGHDLPKSPKTLLHTPQDINITREGNVDVHKLNVRQELLDVLSR